MLQLSNVVPFMTAMTAGPSIRQFVKVLSSMNVLPAFM